MRWICICSWKNVCIYFAPCACYVSNGNRTSSTSLLFSLSLCLCASPLCLSAQATPSYLLSEVNALRRMLVNFAAFPLAIWWQLRRCRLLKILRIRRRAKSANRKCRKRILHAPENTQHTHRHTGKHWQHSNNMHRDMTSDDGTSGPRASQLKGAGNGRNGDGGTATFSLLHSLLLIFLLLLLLQLRFMHFSCLDSVVSFGFGVSSVFFFFSYLVLPCRPSDCASGAYS